VVITITQWTPSCVPPVKLPPLPSAAHANVVHQAVLAIQEKTAKMVTQEQMENQEAQAKMPSPMITSSQCHNNATATLHQAAQANQEEKDPTEAQAMLEHQAVMDNQDQQDHQDQQDQLVKPETMDQKDPTVNQEYKKKAHQAHQAQPANPVPQALQDQQVQPEVQEKMVVLAPQVAQEMLEVQELQENQVALALQETMVPQVPLALALTAHQLVWLQVIKRSSGNAITAFSTISSKFASYAKIHDIKYVLKKALSVNILKYNVVSCQ